ncbi:bifunctional lysylphosphatidylglycerol flippase/synthetase MprF [Zavarzinia sp. CC-PAN008]|uniref:bifunctional lysylphosphatidylglycerol flippase/synthetase MprF n=1 Tax=Zavarzinia sp. CC-PAN008 TaxID=3243332 RepID=UPI003F748237
MTERLDEASGMRDGEARPVARARPTMLGWARAHATPIVALALFGLALYAVRLLLAEIDFDQVMGEIRTLPGSAVLWAVGLAGLSYLALTFYDVSALRWAGVKLPYRTVAFASFVSYAISNSVGFALISGGSVRYRLYAAAGVGPGRIARIIAFCGMAFAVGLSIVGGLGLLLAPSAVAPLLHVSAGDVRLAAALVMLAVATGLTLAAVRGGSLRILRWTVPLPPASLMAAQLVVSAVDLVASAAVLWVLLPGGHDLAFTGFLAIYCAALVAGLVSHVPGGIGVFDAVILLGLGPFMPTDAVAGGLVLYRAIYYVLPLIAAGLALGLREVRAQRLPLRLVRGIPAFLAPMVPMLVAVLVFAGGVVLLVSGATPALESRLDAVGAVLPVALVELSHLVGSIVGLGLLVLAYGLYRRLSGALALAALLCAVGAVVSLAKGFDYEEAAVLTAVLGVLLATRRQFFRPARLLSLRPDAGFVAAVVAVLIGTLAILLFAYQNVGYERDLWWQVELSAEAPRAMRALLAAGICASILGLALLLQPPPPRIRLASPEEIARARAIAGRSPDTRANLALMRDKSLLFSPRGGAFLMYGVHGRSWIAMGDPVGAQEEFADLLWEFRDLVDRHGGVAAFYEVMAECLPVYVDIGLTLVKMGEEAVIDLEAFSLEGARRRDLRYAANRGERDGLCFEVIPRAEVPAHMAALRQVSDAWLEGKRATEKGFSLGAFDRAYLANFDIATVRVGSQIVAFANLWQAAPGTEASLDLMRFVPNLSPVTMDYLFIHMLLWAKAAGFRRFSLGMAPLSGLVTRRSAPLWQRLGALLYAHGERLYGFRGLRAYKQKFQPDWEPRYLACPAGLAPALVLADAAALIRRRPEGDDR